LPSVRSADRVAHHGSKRLRRPAISEDTHILLRTFVALCLGALVGLERQVAQEESKGQKDFPGVRTLAFTALLGALAVLVAKDLGPWFAIALFLSSVAFLVLRYRHDTAERGDPGYTTETASLCTFAVGALAQADRLLIATVITIVMVALLRSKRALHRAGELLSPTDMVVLIRFLVLTGIILPLLPDEPYDPYGVLRPRDVWRMVVLISGLSFLGYVLMRIRAGNRGQILSGLLGGLVSSTATALTAARSARDAVSARPYEARVVLAAGTSFLRMGIIVGAVAPGVLHTAGLPLLAMAVLALTLGLLLQPKRNGALTSESALENPLTLKLAFGFAVVYASVLFLSAAARDVFHDRGAYAVTALAGMIGGDAPAISLARLAADNVLEQTVAAQGVINVAIATMIGKIVILLVIGRPRRMLHACGALLLVSLCGGALSLFL